MLKHYETKAKSMTDEALRYSITDVQATLAIWRDYDNDYTRKLYAEFDAYTVELHRRAK